MKFKYAGINMPQLSFGKAFPGKAGTDYKALTKEDMKPFRDAGFNTVHLAMQWERIQPDPSLFKLSHGGYLDEVLVSKTSAQELGLQCIVGVRSFAEHLVNGSLKILGSQSAPADRFLWMLSELAATIGRDQHIDIMNEPRPPIDSHTWSCIAELATRILRNERRMVLACGNGYSAAAGWYGNWYGTANGTTMGKVALAGATINVHCYLDQDGSGEYKTPAVRGSGATVLGPVTNWARMYGAELFLGEFGVPNDAAAIKETEDMLGFMYDNRDVWQGWCWWAGGPWWGSYKLAIDPKSTDPRVAMLKRWM